MLITCVDSICVKCLNAGKILYGLGNNLCLFDGENQTFCDVKPRDKSTSSGTSCKDKLHRIDFLEIQSNEFKIICGAGREILCAELKDVSRKHKHLSQIINQSKHFRINSLIVQSVKSMNGSALSSFTKMVLLV